MKEFAKIYNHQNASFKRIAVHNTEHINGVIMGVETGEMQMQGKFVPHKDGTFHYDADVSLSSERYPKPQEIPITEEPKVVVIHGVQAQFHPFNAYGKH